MARKADDWDVVMELVAVGRITAQDLLDAGVITPDEHADIQRTVENVRYAASQGRGLHAYTLVMAERWRQLERLVAALRSVECLEIEPEGETLDGVGGKLGVTRERIRQIELSALAALANSRKLQAFAESCSVREFASGAESRILPAGRYGTDPLLAPPLRVCPAARALQIRNGI